MIVIDSSDDEERPEPQARPRAADAAAFATSGSQHGSSSQPAGLQKQPANPGGLLELCAILQADCWRLCTFRENCSVLNDLLPPVP